MAKLQVRLIALLACALVAPMIGATGTKEQGAASTAGPVALKMCMAQQQWGGSTDPDLQAAFKALLEKATNTKIEMIAPPHNDYTAKLNVLLAAGDVPDVFHIYTAMKNVPVYMKRGYLAAIDDYLKDAPTLAAVNKDLFPQQDVFDGKTWAVPDGRNLTILMFLRKDLLDKYGAKVPATTDEFAASLRSLKAGGIVPFTNAKQMSYFRLFFSSFGAYDDLVRDAGGKYSDGFATPQMKAALQWLAGLYAEGLLDKEFITNTTAQMREKVYAGKAGGAVYWDINYTTFQVESQKIDPKAEITPVFKLTGPSGAGETTNWGIDGAFGVGAKSANKAAALKVIQFFSTNDGYIARFSGVAGQHYTVDAKGTAVPTRKAADSGYAINAADYIKTPFKLTMPFGLPAEITALAAKQFDLSQKALAGMGPFFVVPPGRSEIYDKVTTSLSDKRTELSTKAIIGAASMDDIYKSYDAFWKSINGDQMLQELNK